jgi:hypothetical protein
MSAELSLHKSTSCPNKELINRHADFLQELQIKVDSQQKTISDLQQTVRSQGEQLAKLEFMVSNPAKYKVGQKVGDWIITGVEPRASTKINAGCAVVEFDGSYHWLYFTTNTITGEIDMKSQDELATLKKTK